MANERKNNPVIIAGPCSVESRTQTLDTCREIARGGYASMLRGGVWKPRTSPKCFQGAGECGLEWLREAKSETGLPFGVEVANARHVEAALKSGADMIWIGARTTGNPFSVQEIADSLRGTNILVLVKNSMMPDIGIWIGAIERLVQSGHSESDIGLIHRGFSFTSDNTYRNPPLWHLALEMRSRVPELKMLCDPSHICGRRETIPSTIQEAADLMYDGLFVESHTDPDHALSDPKQQLTPEALGCILKEICWRSENPDTSIFEKELQRMRLEIDEIDSQIFGLLSHRMQVSDKIGELKRANNITILQRKRWSELVEKWSSRASALGLSRKFVHDILDAVHMESISHQNEIMNRLKKE